MTAPSMTERGSSDRLTFATLGGEQSARVFRAPGSAAAVLIAPALGVRASYYERLAQALADRGLSACAVDTIGSGDSPVVASRARDWGYNEVIEHYGAALAALRRGSEVSSVFMLGHSIGGHVALMLGGTQPPGLRGVVLAASGTPWWRAWQGPAAAGVFVGTRVIRWSTLAAGYYPGRLLRFGGREPKTLMMQWAEAARSNRFEGAGWSGEPLFGQPGPPTLAIALDGDRFAPESAVRALVGKLQGRSVEVVRWADPPDDVDHNRWPRAPAFVADRVVDFVRRVTSAAA